MAETNEGPHGPDGGAAAAVETSADLALMMLSAVGASARDLAVDSIAPNTRRSYAGALKRLDDWLDGRALDDTSLAKYLGVLFANGRSAGSAAVTVAAVRFEARISDHPNPVGPATERVLAGYRRAAADRGRGQAAPMTADDLAAIVATARQPRRTGRGVESAEAAERRGLVDVAVAGLLFHGGLRRSEVAALRVGDVEPAAHVAGAVVVTVRSSKTKPDGAAAAKRFVKGPPAAAVLKLRDAAPEPGAPLIGLSGRQVARRIEAAGRAAGLERRLTGHSGRVGLVSELTSRGADTASVMLAGGWKTARMVAHYGAGATAERGAVAKYL